MVFPTLAKPSNKNLFQIFVIKILFGMFRAFVPKLGKKIKMHKY